MDLIKKGRKCLHNLFVFCCKIFPALLGTLYFEKIPVWSVCSLYSWDWKGSWEAPGRSRVCYGLGAAGIQLYPENLERWRCCTTSLGNLCHGLALPMGSNLLCTSTLRYSRVPLYPLSFMKSVGLMSWLLTVGYWGLLSCWIKPSCSWLTKPSSPTLSSLKNCPTPHSLHGVPWTPSSSSIIFLYWVPTLNILVPCPQNP